MVLRYARTRPRHLIRFLPRLWVGTVSQPSSRASSMTASWVGPTNVPPRSTGDARDRRGRRPAADPVAALHDDDVVAEPGQFARGRQPREPCPDDHDVGVGWHCVTGLGSHAVKVMTALFGPINAIEQARALRDAGASGVFTFEGTHDVFAPLTLASTVGGLDLMTNVAIAFPRNPIHLAHQAIDHQLLSEGRFALGLGTQIRTQIEKRFGAEFDKPVARMTELIAALRAIFESWTTGERLNFRGEYYRHTLMTPTFSPGENPYGPPPIYVGALGPRLTRATARARRRPARHAVRQQAVPA